MLAKRLRYICIPSPLLLLEKEKISIMNINELAKNLCDRAVALELITWLRENELLADNSGDIATDSQLAEQFAFFG